MKNFFSNKYVAYGVALLSGILSFLSDFPNPNPLLAWIAPVPVLVVAIQRGFPTAFLLGLLYAIPTNVGSQFLNLPYFIPIFIRILIFFFAVLFFSSIFYFTIYFIRRLGVSYAPWVNAFGVTTFASILQDLAGFGHQLPFAYTQFELSKVRSIASLGGDNLVLFVLYLFAGAVSALVIDRSKKTMLSSGSAFIVILLLFIWGSVIPERNKEASKLKVAAIAINYSKEIAERVWQIDKVQSADTWYLFGEYEKLSRQAAKLGALVIVWPEYGLWVLPEDMELFQNKVKSLAMETKSVISAGFIDVKNTENNSLLAVPNGEKEIFTKHNLVPGGESLWLKAGKKPYSLVKINQLGITISTSICFDNDFSLENRDAALNGSDIFIAPSADAITHAPMHATAHAFRSIENGIPMIRPTLTGRTIIVDFDGSVIAESKNYEPSSVNMILGDVTLNRKPTPFRKFGYWIVYLSFLFTGIMIVFPLFRKNQLIT